MFALFALMFWITIAGANLPSGWLATLLVDKLWPVLREGMSSIGSPWWLTGFLVDGVYLATAWVVSVMTGCPLGWRDALQATPAGFNSLAVHECFAPVALRWSAPFVTASTEFDSQLGRLSS